MIFYVQYKIKNKKLRKLNKLKKKKLKEKKKLQKKKRTEKQKLLKKNKKKQRMKQRLKRMLANFLKENPWKNKNMFEGRLNAIKCYKKRGTLPGVRLANPVKKSCCNRHNHVHDPIPVEEKISNQWKIYKPEENLHNINNPINNSNQYSLII